MSKKNVLYPSRVTMLDAESLDTEVFNILKNQLLNILQIIPPWVITKYDIALDVILHYVIWKVSILKTNSTFGQQLLNMKYNDEELNDCKKKVILISQLLCYMNSAYGFHEKCVLKIRTWLELTVQILSFANFLYFLRDGKYPSLTDRVLRIRPICIVNKPRPIGYGYMTRELLWHGFVELLTFSFSIVNYQYLKRKIIRLFLIKRYSATSSLIKLNYTKNTRCAICSERPILPQHIGCSHAFCYYCIQANRLVDSNFECPSCGFYQKDIEFVSS